MGKSIEQRVAELEKEMKKLKAEKKLKISKKLGVGDTFEIQGLMWKILKITEDGYMCLADRLEDDKTFGENNNWKDSTIRAYLNGEFYEQLAAEVGEEYIVPFKRNLLSLDGQTEYGTCEDKVSLISFDEYRELRELIPNAGYWWWTLTPYSTKCNEDERWKTVVSPHGGIGNYGCGSSFVVRPFCIFASSLFESKVEE